MIQAAEYLRAAERKIEIAAYHAHHLKTALKESAGKDYETPAISVQAHFEGTAVAVIAAVDQVALAIKKGLDLSYSSSSGVEPAYRSIGETLPQVVDWFEDPLGVDARRVRVRMVHYAYAKTQVGPAWHVESADTEYDGPRTLLEYARAMVAYGQRLADLIPDIEKVLSNSDKSGS